MVLACLATLVLLPGLGLLPSISAAQPNYDSLDMAEQYVTSRQPPESDEKNYRLWKRSNSKQIKARIDGNRALKDSLAAGQAISGPSQKYLDEYVFPAMTQTDANTLSTFGETRRRFIKDYLSDSVKGSARQQMLTVTIESLRKILANDALHPSARVNAVVLLSWLTDRPAIRTAGQIPIASGQAFDTLLAIFNSNNEDNFPQYLKIAALTGIKHHAQLKQAAGRQVDEASRSTLVAKLNSVIDSEADASQAPADYWMKRQAIQLTGLIGDAKSMNAIVKALTDEKSSLAMQLDALRSIKQLSGQNASPKRNGEALAAVCKFASDFVSQEAVNIEAAIEKLVYENILYGNEDLRVSGWESRDNPAAKTGPANALAPRGETGRGIGGMDDFDMGGMDDFGGGGMGGMDDFDGGMGMGMGNQMGKLPLLDLPNYQLQVFRNRIKSIAVFCRDAIGTANNRGLRRALDPKAESLASKTVARLNSLVNDSSIGIIDLEVRRRPGDPDPETTPKEESYAENLKELCTKSGQGLAGLMSDFGGAPVE